MKKLIAALGLVALIGGCATNSVVKHKNNLEIKADRASLNLVRLDSNKDGKYDMIFIEKREKVPSKLVLNVVFSDRDFNGTIDIVVGDYFNAKKEQIPNGIYDIVENFEEYFKRVFSREPTEKEKTIDGFYEELVKEL